jgi:hypothetical protein
MRGKIQQGEAWQWLQLRQVRKGDALQPRPYYNLYKHIRAGRGEQSRDLTPEFSKKNKIEK